MVRLDNHSNDMDMEVFKIIGDLGTTGILGVFSWLVWNDRKERQVRSDDLIEKKDCQVDKLHKATREVIIENTRSQIELRNVVTINTEVTKSLQDALLNGIKANKEVKVSSV